MKQNINGILLLDKPKGITSNAALQRVKYLFNAKKAGHAGSLDPIATGMLPIFFGAATKFSQFLLNADKHYYVTAQCGTKTTTGDADGDIISERNVPAFSRETLEKVLASFVGKLSQIPPMYSAIKYQGRPLYQLARQGIEVDRNPRTVTIYSVALQAFNLSHFSFTVHCSKGTYVRTLVEEIGEKLTCGAHITELRRTSVTPYLETRAYSLSTLEKMASEWGHRDLLDCLLPIDTSLQTLPAINLSVASSFYLRNGQPVRASTTSPMVRVYGENGMFLGVCESLADGRIKPMRLIT